MKFPRTGDADKPDDIHQLINLISHPGYLQSNQELPRIQGSMTTTLPTQEPNKPVLRHCTHLWTRIGYP